MHILRRQFVQSRIPTPRTAHPKKDDIDCVPTGATGILAAPQWSSAWAAWSSEVGSEVARASAAASTHAASHRARNLPTSSSPSRL